MLIFLSQSWRKLRRIHSGCGMRILGIDPGSRITGFGIIEWDGRNVVYIESGCIRVSDRPMPARLAEIFDSLTQIIHHFKPAEAAIEQVFLAHNVSSALKLGQARGAAIVAIARANIPLSEYSARQAKLAVAGNGNADKKQVQYMIKHLFKLSVSPPADAADALGIALCHLHNSEGIHKIQPVKVSNVFPALKPAALYGYKRKRIQ